MRRQRAPTCCRRPPVTRPPRSIGKKPAAPNSPATAALAAASSPDRKITRRPPASFGSAPSTLATSVPPVAYTAMTLAAWQGQETPAAELIEATAREAAASGQGRLVDFAAYASAVLYNGLGRHDAARDAAWRAFERDQLGYGPLVVPELAEAASRTGDVAAVRAALNWLSERAQVTPTDWALGIEALVRALLREGEAAEIFYRESIARLGRTRVRAQLARAHLLYGEWLRRERRRADAREQLRTAHGMLDTMGIDAFAERARRELAATGETARKRTVETATELTAQEAQIARLARDGLSNPEIGARCSSAPAQSSTTWPRCSPSSPSAPATNFTAPCPPAPTPPGRGSPPASRRSPASGRKPARPRLATRAVPSADTSTALPVCVTSG